MSGSGIPDCFGSDCKYFEFVVDPITPISYSYKDPKSGRWYRERFSAEGSPSAPKEEEELKGAFRKAVGEVYQGQPSNTCEKDCICQKIDGDTKPQESTATKEHTHIIDDPKSKYDGYEVEGTYGLKVKVYKGVCVPLKTQTGKPRPEKKELVCCEPDYYDYYYRCYVRYRPYWHCYGPYWSHRRRWC